MKFKNKEDVHKRALEALGKTVSDLQSEMPEKKASSKSIYGDAWESWFKVKKNNSTAQDLKDVGIELKAAGLKKVRNGITAKERLVLNRINYVEEFKLQNIYDSNFFKKNKTLEIGFYFYEPPKNKTEFIFKSAMQFKFPEKDWLIIKNDWELIHKYIKEGRAHELSGGLTNILEACTKAKNAIDRVPQHPSLNAKEAKPRAYALKKSYMSNLVRDYIYGDKVDSNIQVGYEGDKFKSNRESIVENLKDIEEISLEEFVISKINEFKGKTTTELSRLFSIDTETKPKQLQWLIVRKILGLKCNPDKAEEFEKSGIKVKTIRLEDNNMPKESMSLPYFEFEELIKSKWEESSLFNYLEQTKFLFVVFKNVEGEYILKGAKFWNMPLDMIEGEAKTIWKKTRKIINKGVKLKAIKLEKGYRIINNLPKANEKGSIMHVRPHTRKRSYVDNENSSRLPKNAEWTNKPDGYSNNFMTKQSFWFNKEYISQLLEEFYD